MFSRIIWHHNPTFTHNTHKKSAHVYSGHFSTPLFFPSTKEHPSLSEPWEKRRENDGTAPASFQRVKVSLLARWLVHSADVTWSLSRRSHLARLLLQDRLLFCLLGPAWLAATRRRPPPSTPASSVLWADPVRARRAHKGRFEVFGMMKSYGCPILSLLLDSSAKS